MPDPKVGDMVRPSIAAPCQIGWLGKIIRLEDWYTPKLVKMGVVKFEDGLVKAFDLRALNVVGEG